LETYREGLKHDPNNQELLDGISKYEWDWPKYLQCVYFFKFPFLT
jgi:hypothetical protein